jgi:hypothetical protein
MDTVTIEQAVVSYLAGQLNMTIDNDIFRGGMPSESTDAAALVFEQRKAVERRSQDAFSASLFVRRTDRDSLLAVEAQFSAILPVFGVSSVITGYTVLLHSLRRDGYGGISPASFNGQECYLMQQKLIVTVNSVTANP